MMKIFQNLDIKILSVFSAVMLWIFVVGIENSVLILPESLDVHAVNMAKSLSLESPLPQVKLYVRVDQSSLKTVTRNDFDLTVDLSGLPAGDYQLPVIAESKNPQATVLKTDPAQIYVHLAPLAEKEVPVLITYKGSPLAGFTVSEVKSETAVASVSAAQNVLEKIKQVNAEIILTGTENTNLTQTVQLSFTELSDIPKDSIHISPAEISVTAIIIPQPQQKTVIVKPNVTGADATPELLSRIQTTPAQVVIQGDAALLAGIDSVPTIPLDAAFLLRKEGEPFEAGLTLPAGITLANPQEIIKIVLTKADTI